MIFQPFEIFRWVCIFIPVEVSVRRPPQIGFQSLALALALTVLTKEFTSESVTQIFREVFGWIATDSDRPLTSKLNH